MLIPATTSEPRSTRLFLDSVSDKNRLPVVLWAGVAGPDLSIPADPLTLGGRRGTSFLIEHSSGTFERPGLRGHRLADSASSAGDDSREIAGRAWSTAFVPSQVTQTATGVVIDAEDQRAGLTLRIEVEALPGGAIRGRHTLTNMHPAPYLVEACEFSVPLPADFAEVLDFSGRHEGERQPQRHEIADGIWLRESRHGRPGLDATGVVVAGTRGFTFGSGELIAVSVATSGNSSVAVQRNATAGPSMSAGELLLPGEMVLPEGHSYVTPWVVIAASCAGLDAAAQALHTWQRSLPAHPALQPVTLNVWEAVFFDHDLGRLKPIADLGARVGVERFVLDDGWFHQRRDDTAGLGDWWVDRDVWPEGLTPLIEHVHGLGMEFGLWFEPEMINPDSDLFRLHPDWVLSPEGRLPFQHRNQYVLDLTNPHAFEHIRHHVDAVLAEYPIDYVKWDHNRDLLEAGSSAHQGAPAAHLQAQAFLALLDELRAGHPRVQWESCAAGGGRIDLGVIERVQRFWTSDMTDALARQQIQRWTGQFIAPEYLGAHVSAPVSHQTGRQMSLAFRAATAFFLAFGIEWDLTRATAEELDELAVWCALHKRFRPLLHSGFSIRVDTNEPAVMSHGVVAQDGSAAILCYVQLDELRHNRGTTLRLPGLLKEAEYVLRWLGPVENRKMSESPPLLPVGPTGGAPVTGGQLAHQGIWVPRRIPLSALLIEIARA